MRSIGSDRRARVLVAIPIVLALLVSVGCELFPGPVAVSWAGPGAGSTISGTATLTFTGQAMANVEVFQGSQMVSRATSSSDGTSATATLDTRSFPNGPITFRAHAWNSTPGTAFSSEADAGSRTFTIANGAAANDDFHPSGYTLAFADEFGGTTLDRGRWCTRMIYGGGATPQVPDAACQRNGEGTLDFLNDEQQRYVDTNRNGEAMHRVSGGVLSLRATRTRPDDSWASYESAMIRSKQLFRPTTTRSYYLTTRVRLPDVVGTWPAFWLNSDRQADGSTSWPPEIDIFEGALNGRDDRVEMLHLASIIRGQQTASGDREITFSAPEYDRRWGNHIAGSSLRNRWIEVGVEWTATNVCWFIDGYRSVCENYRWVTNGGAQAAPAHVILNLAIGGSWAGRYGIDSARFPTTFDIDRVRVYSKG